MSPELRTEAARTWLTVQSFGHMTREQYRQLFLAIEEEAVAPFRAVAAAADKHIGRFSGQDFDRDHEELRAALVAALSAGPPHTPESGT